MPLYFFLFNGKVADPFKLKTGGLVDMKDVNKRCVHMHMIVFIFNCVVLSLSLEMSPLILVALFCYQKKSISSVIVLCLHACF